MALVQLLSAFDMWSQLPNGGDSPGSTRWDDKTGHDGSIDVTWQNYSYATYLQGDIQYDPSQVSPYGLITSAFFDGTDAGIFPDLQITGLSYNLTVAEFNDDVYHPKQFTLVENMLAGNDTLIGSSGNDTMLGFGGNDTLIGGAGGDFLEGDTGINTASYSTASGGVVARMDTAIYNTGEAAGDAYSGIRDLIGSNYNDVLYGNNSANSLSGGNGDDILAGIGSSYDSLNGGNGRDTVSYDLAPGAVRVDLINSSVNYGDAAGDVYTSIENVYGGGYDDYLYGDDAANLLNGGAAVSGTGNDHLYGRGGNDTMYGSDGNDVLMGGGGRDILDGGLGTDTLDYTDKTQKVQLALNGAAAVTVLVNGVAEDSVKNFERVLGGSAGDVLTGDGLANLFYGNGGNDSIASGSGTDTVRGGTGADVLDGGSGTDTADYSDKSSAIAVTLNGATAVLVKVGAANEDSIKNFENVIGGSGADHIVGDGLANTIRGGVGKDILDGGAGIDTADYSEKTQKVTVTLNGATAVSVFINGTAAANVEDSIKNFENVIGGSAGDKLTGDSLANVLVGGFGNDSLSGAGGNDILIGGANNDSLTGGAGTDHFRFAFNIDLLNGVDTITDFVHGSDRIEFDNPGTTTPVQVGTAFLGESNFVPSNSTALFIYDYSSGVLYYDLVPGIAGGEIAFAVLQNHAVIDATDLWFV